MVKLHSVLSSWTAVISVEEPLILLDLASSATTKGCKQGLGIPTVANRGGSVTQ